MENGNACKLSLFQCVYTGHPHSLDICSLDVINVGLNNNDVKLEIASTLSMKSMNQSKNGSTSSTIECIDLAAQFTLIFSFLICVSYICHIIDTNNVLILTILSVNFLLIF